MTLCAVISCNHEYVRQWLVSNFIPSFIKLRSKSDIHRGPIFPVPQNKDPSVKPIYKNITSSTKCGRANSKNYLLLKMQMTIFKNSFKNFEKNV